MKLLPALIAGVALSLILVCSCGGGDGGVLLVPSGSESRCLMLDGDTNRLSWPGDGSVVWDAPLGDRVLFSLPLPDGEDFRDYGLGKFDLNIEGGTVDVMVFVERPNEKRRVYRPIDIGIPRDGWQTVHFDLAVPEIVRESHFTADSPRITFNLWAVKGGYPEEESTRRITIKNVRLVKKRLDVRWDGVEYTSRMDADGALVYEYPISVVNLNDEARLVTSELEHMTGHLGTGAIEPDRARIAPGDSASFNVTLRLEGKDVSEVPPLYCEWFRPMFAVEGVNDSKEGILRSSDRIELPLIVMPERLDNPVIVFDRDGVGAMREHYRSTVWGRKEGDDWIRRAEQALEGDLTIPDGPGWAAAYYYCVEHRCPLKYEGPGKHKCPVGGEYHDVDFMGVDLDRDWRTNQHAAMFNNARYCALAYALTGETHFSDAALSIIRQYREKYFTWDWLDLDASTETIDRGRVQFAKYMEAIYMLYLTEAYDILKGLGAVSASDAADLERHFIIPISVEMTDYRMGMIHRQQAIVKNALATGLATGHAPLVAFATAGDRNLFMLRRCAATADGIAHGHGYANPTRRQLEMAAMLDRAGVDTYDHMLRRLLWGTIWWDAPFNPSKHGRLCLLAAKHYPDVVYRAHASRNLIDGEVMKPKGLAVDVGTPPSVNFPQSGLSILRRPWKKGTLDAEFKWGMPDNRGSFSVLSLGLYFGGYYCQSYPGHFPWGSTDLHHEWQIQSASHSTLVVDRRNQSGMKDYFKDHYMPHASKQLWYEEDECHSSTVAFNDRIYPGVAVWRAVCVLDGACLVLDNLRSDEEHVYDRWFHGVPDKSNGLAGIGVPMSARSEPLGDTDGYEMVTNLSAGSTDSDFTCDWNIGGDHAVRNMRLAMRVLNDQPIETVHGFEWSRQYRTREKEFLMLSRRAKNADFIALYEPYTGRSKVTLFERFDVVDSAGAAVDGATGIRIVIAGKTYEIHFNPDNAEIDAPGGVTDDVMTVDVVR